MRTCLPAAVLGPARVMRPEDAWATVTVLQSLVLLLLPVGGAVTRDRRQTGEAG